MHSLSSDMVERSLSGFLSDTVICKSLDNILILEIQLQYINLTQIEERDTTLQITLTV